MLAKEYVDDQKNTDEKVLKLDPHFSAYVREVRLFLELPMDVFAKQVKISTEAFEKLETGDTRSSLIVCKRVQKFLMMVLAAHMMEKMKRLKKDDQVELNRSTLLQLLPRVEEKKRKKH